MNEIEHLQLALKTFRAILAESIQDVESSNLLIPQDLVELRQRLSQIDAKIGLAQRWLQLLLDQQRYHEVVVDQGRPDLFREAREAAAPARSEALESPESRSEPPEPPSV